MSQNRTTFENAARAANPDFQVAFNNLNTLSMEEMLKGLAAIGKPALDKLWARRFSYARGLDMPRMEYAMSVVMNRKLPVIAPGSLSSNGQVGDAAKFLGVSAPTGAQFAFTVLTVETQSVTQKSIRTKHIKCFKDILASQGGGFELAESSHPTALAVGDLKSQDSLDDLAAKVDPLALAQTDRLVMVFGDWLVPGERGSTRKSTSGKRFCVVDTSSLGPDDATMIHEAMHAADLDHIEDDAKKSRPVAVWDESNVLRESPTIGRKTITVGQGEKMASAFFARKK